MLKRFFHDLKKYFNYALQLASATLKAEVAGSYLNWIWWILNPLCFMLIYTFIFGVVFKARETFFSIYIFIGITMWNFFNQTIKNSVKMIKRNKAILSRVYLPKFVLILSEIMENGFKMIISFGIVIIMIIYVKVPFSWTMLYSIPVLVVLILVTFAFSCFVLHFGVFIQDLSNIITILLRILFYLTGIFYDIQKRVPAPANFWVLRLNPTACMLNQMREALLYGEAVLWEWLVGWFVTGLLLSLLGIHLIYKNENNYVKVV